MLPFGLLMVFGFTILLAVFWTSIHQALLAIRLRNASLNNESTKHLAGYFEYCKRKQIAIGIVAFGLLLIENNMVTTLMAMQEQVAPSSVDLYSISYKLAVVTSIFLLIKGIKAHVSTIRIGTDHGLITAP
jgi:hypothetical protein